MRAWQKFLVLAAVLLSNLAVARVALDLRSVTGCLIFGLLLGQLALAAHWLVGRSRFRLTGLLLLGGLGMPLLSRIAPQTGGLRGSELLAFLVVHFCLLCSCLPLVSRRPESRLRWTLSDCAFVITVLSLAMGLGRPLLASPEAFELLGLVAFTTLAACGWLRLPSSGGAAIGQSRRDRLRRSNWSLATAVTAAGCLILASLLHDQPLAGLLASSQGATILLGLAVPAGLAEREGP